MILLVDDNSDLRQATYELLTAAGYEVVQAADAESALALFEQAYEADPSRFEILISDYRLPGQDGLWLARLLSERNPQLRGLLMTSHLDDRARQWTDGGLVTLTKPYAAEDLMSLVEALADEPPLTPPRRKIDDAVPRQPAPPSPLAATGDTPAKPWLARAIGGALLAAAAVMVALFLVPRQGSPPPLPDRVAEEVTRSGVVDLISPRGPISGVPTALTWSANTDATHYRVEVLAVDDTVLSSFEIEAGADSQRAEVTVDVPPSLRGQLLENVAYYWRIDALAAGDLIAVSEAVRFRIIASASVAPLGAAPAEGPADVGPTEER